MNENILRAALKKIYLEEFSEFSRAPEHTFSAGHRRRIGKILRLYAENKSGVRAETPPRAPSGAVRFNRKTVCLAVVLVFLAVIAVGGGALYFSLGGFTGTRFSDHLRISASDTENGYESIEYEYYLPEIPAGYRLIEKNVSAIDVYYCYEDDTGRYIIFSQDVKSGYTTFPDVERSVITEIDINGHTGLCFDFSDETMFYIEILWDNGDYLITIATNLSVEETLNLAKSTKILEK